MWFDLEADGVHVSCSSPTVTRKLLEKGARFIREEQAEYLRFMLETGTPSERLASGSPQPPRR